MKALVQRVSQAAVDVEGDRVAQIGPGMLVLLGVSVDDGEAEADRLADKVMKLRIFDDAEGRMNEPIGDEREILCVSQFTLYGDTRKGNRPSYVEAAPGDEADRLAEKVRNLRIFDDAEGRMNEPLGEREVLCVSQFTLYGDTRRGNRPSYTGAARPEVAQPLYDRFCERLGAKRGVFGACMGVALINDGPVTLLVEVPAAG